MQQLLRLIEFGPADVLTRLISQSPQLRNGKELRILDIGSGGAKYWEAILRLNSSSISVTLLDPASPQILPKLTQLGRVQYAKGLAPQGLLKLPDQSFDMVVAVDLIEHLQQSDGYKLLYEIERICSWRSLIFTPNGFVAQPPSLNNPFNAHISSWTPSQLFSMGWSHQRGHTGFRPLFGRYGHPKARSNFMKWAARLTAPLVRYAPIIAFSFSAVKRHDDFRNDIHEGVN